VQKVPGNYSGSYLERRVIIRQLDVNGHNLVSMERIVDRLADSVSGSGEQFDHFEVTMLLRCIARAVERAREAVKQREPA
jgi:hypothetical protein